MNHFAALYGDKVMACMHNSKNNRPAQVADSEEIVEVMKAVNRKAWMQSNEHFSE